MSLNSLRWLHNYFRRDIKISVSIVHSWASSIITAEYYFNSGSFINSFKSFPSVKKIISVLSLTLFSNQIEYPTSFPMETFISFATLEATLIAANLQGYEMAIF